MKVDQGFILLARKLLDSEVWSWPSDFLRLWIWLLLSVNWRDEYSRDFGDGLIVRKGQILKSMRAISREASGFGSRNHVVNWAPQTISNMLKKMEKAGMLTLESTRLGTLISISNMSYQAFSTYKSTPSLTAHGQTTDNNKHKSIEQKNITALWEVYLEELGNKSGRQFKLTDTRRKLLKSLWSEHLADSENPLDLFRSVCETLKASPWHSQRRSWLLPESFLSNPERRERWIMEATASTQTSDHNVGRDWSPDK